MIRRGLEMEKYTRRTIDKLLSGISPHKNIGCWHDGKFYVAWADQSKSKCGVKYNRLVRLHKRLTRNLNPNMRK